MYVVFVAYMTMDVTCIRFGVLTHVYIYIYNNDTPPSSLANRRQSLNDEYPPPRRLSPADRASQLCKSHINIIQNTEVAHVCMYVQQQYH